MTAKVLPFTGVTRLNLPADYVLQAALDGKIDPVIVVGYNDEGLYLAATQSDAAHVLWMLEQAKLFLMHAATTPDFIADREAKDEP